jgi:hypothetical protein
MRDGLGRFTWVMLLVALVFAGNAPAYAQGGGNSTTLSGVVADATGSVLPGVSIEAKENATGAMYTAVSDNQGRFVIPNIAPGTYTVKVSLQGFKAFVAPDVKILTATPATLQAKLEIGALTESVVVSAATDIVQTQTATVSSTISVNQIQKLPVITHTALDAVVFTAGVETVGSNTRGSTINGLPTTAINITLDGINAQDKRGSEGFFMLVRPMMDSVEEITVSTSTLGADASGSGGATIRMTTRSGANRFSGSAYTTWRNQAGTNAADALSRNKHPGWLWRMNTPYWFNKRDLPKTAAGDEFINDVRLQTPGFRVGGPIQKDKMFYFFNYEEFRLPESRSRTRTLLSAAAQAGTFTYTRVDNGQTETVNLLTLAASSGLTSTIDPTIARLTNDIRTATGTTGRVRNFDQNLDQFDYAPSATQLRRFPTTKIDYNLTSTQRLSGTYRYNKFDSTPDFLNSAEATFPGFPQQGTQISGRYSWQVNLNSVYGKWVNEARYGVENMTGRGSAFNGNITPESYNCTAPGCQQIGSLGYAIGFPANNAIGGAALTGVGARNPSWDTTAQFSFEDSLTYVSGAHSLALGASWGRLNYRSLAQTMHSGSITLGMQTNDPANLVFDAATGTTVFPGGINATQAGYSKNLYAMLTGRVTSFAGQYVLQPDGTFAYHGETVGSAIRNDYGFYANDTWRVKPNLTLGLGLRYQLEMPITTKGLYSVPEDWRQVYGITGAGDGYLGSGNLYKPGVLQGTNDIGVVRYQPGDPPYKTDFNNFAPSLQATWRPNIGNGPFSWLLSSDPVLRGGYSTTFDKLGTDTFTGNYGGNIGRTRTGTRNATSGTPFLGFDGWPVLMRDTSKLYASPSPAPLGENFRLTPLVNESIDIHHPDWKTPIIHQYSAGVQRQIGRDLGLEVRYVGNISTGGWTTWNMNAMPQWSILENGFYDEFRAAQGNLRANIVAGRGNTFAYTGAPGTTPLPIFMAYFAGIPLADARNRDAANYTAAQFANLAWYNQLSMYSPNLVPANNPTTTSIAGTGANGLQNGLGLGTGLDVNRQRAGLPANFFMANPAIAQGSAFLEVNGGNRKFNAMQVDLTKRLSHGFSVQTNYAYAFGRKTWQQRSLRENWFYVDSGAGSDHTFKLSSTYELPFGQGRAFGTSAGRLLDGLIGGWEMAGLMRWQSGPKFNYGAFRLVGMTEEELQGMFKFYRRTAADGIERIYMLPEDVIDNSVRAIYNTSATTVSGLTGEAPTGRYLAPANGPDCVSYAEVQCPGTQLTRLITGPGYFKTDMSFVKRVLVSRRANVELRMDIFNVFNTINFTPTSRNSANAVTGWDVTAAAQDVNASQDLGGRITQFGLRFTF